MKILFCIPTLETGGAERQLEYLAGALRRDGHEVHVACGRGGAHRDALVAAGAIVHDIGRGAYDPRLVAGLVRLMRQLRPDVVQTCLTQMDVAGGAAALMTRTPWVLREASSAESHPRGWKSALRRMLGRRAAAIVANSRAGDAYWRDTGASRRRVVPNAVPFVDAESAREANAVLFAGRLDDAKNAGAVIEALRLVDGDWTATFCGDGPLRAHLERRTRELALGERIRFAGTVADVRERMQRAAVVVSLSRWEGSPNVALEAMASGCPLVVSDIAAHRALLDESCALFVGCDDAAGAATAIARVLHDRGEATARAEVARARARQWSIESMADAYLAIYESARSHASSISTSQR